MINSPVYLQDLREKISIKAKTDKTHKFWGIYVHVCKMETLLTAYKLAKQNNGSPGIDGLTFEDIEKGIYNKEKEQIQTQAEFNIKNTPESTTTPLEQFLLQIQKELLELTYYPSVYRKHEIPKENGKIRVLSIPTIKDRVVQIALKLILEPIFEADFQDGSYGYRPGRKPKDAIKRVEIAILQNKTKVLDIDIQSFFDNVRHHILLEKVAKRTTDPNILKLVKRILKVNGRKGIPQGGPISPLLANIYLNDIDILLEKIKEDTKTTAKNNKQYSAIEYARFADDLVVLINIYWSKSKIEELLNELKTELLKLDLNLNEDKTKLVDLENNESFSFLGFDFRRIKGKNGKWFPLMTPRMKARTILLRKVKDIFKKLISQPIQKIINIINPILRGWCNYFRIGNSYKCFKYIQTWILKKVRRHLMRARNRWGYGWKRWSNDWIYNTFRLYNDYQIRYI